jgi:hypothetical protein
VEQVKQSLQSAAPRTLDELVGAAKAAFEAISTADGQGFFLYAYYGICLWKHSKFRYAKSVRIPYANPMPIAFN